MTDVTEKQLKALCLMSDGRLRGGAAFGTEMDFRREDGRPFRSRQGLGLTVASFMARLKKKGLVQIAFDKHSWCHMWKLTPRGREIVKTAKEKAPTE